MALALEAAVLLALTAVAAAQASTEAYVFALGTRDASASPLFRDWDLDGDLDVILQEGAVIKVWRGAGRKPWFPLRPDVEIPLPPGCLWAARVLPGGSAAAEELPSSLVALDAEGVLAWESGAGWDRVFEGDLWFGDGARAVEPPSVQLTDAELLADYDGDGHGDLVVVDRDGAWRVVWGPLRAGVRAGSTALPAASRPARRLAMATFGPRADGLSGLAERRPSRERSGVASILRANRMGEGESLGLRALSELRATVPADEAGGEAVVANRLDSLRWREGSAPGLRDFHTHGWSVRQTAPRLFEVAPRDHADEPPPDLDAPPPPDEALPYSERLQSWAQDLAARSGTDERAISEIRDVNGDDTPDLVHVFGSRDPLQPRTVLSVFLGRADGSLPDARRPDSILRTRAIYSWPVLTDIDNDGDLDTALFFMNIDFASPAEQLKAYLQLGISGTLRVFLWDAADGGYTERRSFPRELNLRYEVFGTTGPELFDARLTGDHDGDGVNDLGFITAKGTYTVWRFDPATGFGAKPMLEINTPDHILRAKAARIDGDARRDLVLITRDENTGRESCRVHLVR